MKEMSLQQAVAFWTYLHSQEELKTQDYLDAPEYGKDEERTEAETYRGLGKAFAENFEQSISSAQDIFHGLSGEQTTGFLNSLDRRLIELKVSQEQTRRQRQAALAGVQGMEYDRVRSIYKAMENNDQRQIIANENARKSFISILEES